MHDFVNSDNPWFVRGGSVSVGGPTVAGVFTVVSRGGRPYPYFVFRSVLAPGA